MNLICKIALRKSIRLEIEEHVRKQDERRQQREETLRNMIEGVRRDMQELRNLVMTHLLTTSSRENELIAEIDALKHPKEPA